MYYKMPNARQRTQNSSPAVRGNSQTTHKVIESYVSSALDSLKNQFGRIVRL